MDDVIHALGSVHLLSGFLHTALERFILQRGEEETPHLTNRERQCLQWAALGKRDADIADKLRISYKKSYYPPSGTSRGKHRIADP